MKIGAYSSIFLLAAISTFAQNPVSPAKSEKLFTANEVIEQIKSHVGVAWQEPTVDTFKAGDPQTRVAGIAVTMMSTLDVLKRAAANGQNLIITHEPTFYDHLDHPTQLPQGEEDAVIALHEDWQHHQQPQAGGYLSGELLRNVEAVGEFIAIMRFESQEAAQALANDPERKVWYQRLVSLTRATPTRAEYTSEWQAS